MKASKLAVSAFLLTCLYSSCNLRMSTECREFFSIPLDQQGKVFSGYPLEKQLTLYRCGLKNRRPPATYLADYIADRGESAIPSLLQTLEMEKDELFQSGIVDIFEFMSSKGHLRNKSEAINRIRLVVARMKISTFKEMAEQNLDKIEKNSAS